MVCIQLYYLKPVESSMQNLKNLTVTTVWCLKLVQSLFEHFIQANNIVGNYTVFIIGAVCLSKLTINMHSSLDWPYSGTLCRLSKHCSSSFKHPIPCLKPKNGNLEQLRPQNELLLIVITCTILYATSGFKTQDYQTNMFWIGTPSGHKKNKKTFWIQPLDSRFNIQDWRKTIG